MCVESRGNTRIQLSQVLCCCSHTSCGPGLALLLGSNTRCTKRLCSLPLLCRWFTARCLEFLDLFLLSCHPGLSRRLLGVSLQLGAGNRLLCVYSYIGHLWPQMPCQASCPAQAVLAHYSSARD